MSRVVLRSVTLSRALGKHVRAPFMATVTPAGIPTHIAFVQQFVDISLRSYHTTGMALAKAKKGGGGKKGGSDEDGDGPGLPDINNTKKSMETVVDRFSLEIAKLKVGKATASMFDDLQLGSLGSISKVGQVTVKNPTLVAIAVYDPSMVKQVAEALKDCGRGFNPTIENSVVSVFIPKPSKESRDVVVKAASKVAEKVQQDLYEDGLTICRGLSVPVPHFHPQ